MTSSLVGSEMCIRDRLMGVLMWKSSLARPPPHLLVHLSLRAAIVHNTLTVSYTHLTLPTICSV
eukprot:1474673-Prorocentrum_lima.AAC.1